MDELFVHISSLRHDHAVLKFIHATGPIQVDRLQSVKQSGV